MFEQPSLGPHGIVMSQASGYLSYEEHLRAAYLSHEGYLLPAYLAPAQFPEVKPNPLLLLEDI